MVAVNYFKIIRVGLSYALKSESFAKPINTEIFKWFV